MNVYDRKIERVILRALYIRSVDVRYYFILYIRII